MVKKDKVLFCITGSVAAYKACSVINYLQKEDMQVSVIMTDAAKKFVTEITFQSLTNKPVYSDMWLPHNQNCIEHIELAKWPNIIVICPATANTISKISLGIADNLLTTVVLASPAQVPVLIVPAMNTNMWNNNVFKENFKKLIGHRKFSMVMPRGGVLACRDEGVGKIAENEEIIRKIKNILKN